MRNQKWGTRGGACTRLKANPSKTLLSSIVLANVCSLENKLDYIRLELTTKREVKNCCGFVLAKTWQNDSVMEDAVSFNGVPTSCVDKVMACVFSLIKEWKCKQDLFPLWTLSF